MKSKIILTVLSVFVSVVMFSQQNPQFTQFWNNYSLYNPANTASGYEIISFRTNYRTKRVESGIQPQLVSANYEHKLKNINSGVGLGYSFSKRNLTKSQKVYLNYAYHLQLPKIKGSISLGISADYQLMKYIPTINGQYLSEESSGGAVNINSGLLFKTEKLRLGFSLTQINETDVNNVNFSNIRHFFALASYDFYFKNRISYTPTIYFKGNFITDIVELNNMFDYKKKVFLGFTYRESDAIGFQLGYQLKLYTRSSIPGSGGLNIGTLKGSPDLIKIMYSYDINIGPLAEYGFNVHEISLKYVLSK